MCSTHCPARSAWVRDLAWVGGAVVSYSPAGQKLGVGAGLAWGEAAVVSYSPSSQKLDVGAALACG
jgi:hypothetical protein